MPSWPRAIDLQPRINTAILRVRRRSSIGGLGTGRWKVPIFNRVWRARQVFREPLKGLPTSSPATLKMEGAPTGLDFSYHRFRPSCVIVFERPEK